MSGRSAQVWSVLLLSVVGWLRREKVVSQGGGSPAGDSSVHVPQPSDVSTAASVGRTATRSTPLLAEPEPMISSGRVRMSWARSHSQCEDSTWLTYTPGTMSTFTRHLPGPNVVHGFGMGVGVTVGVGVGVGSGGGVGVYVGGMGVSVAVGTGVEVGEEVGVGTGVAVGAGVGVWVGSGVAVGVGIARVGSGVFVGGGSGVGSGDVHAAARSPAHAHASVAHQSERHEATAAKRTMGKERVGNITLKAH